LHSAAGAPWQSREVEQRRDGSNGQGTRESKMGKPVRKTLQSGLRPSAISMRPKTGLRVRETTLGSDTHTATPDTKTVCESYIRRALKKVLRESKRSLNAVLQNNAFSRCVRNRTH
jgi:hypothetical protein